MKLEQQVTNLELSKKLKELGVKQESLFYWGNTIGQLDQDCWRVYFFKDDDVSMEYVSAFTVAELGEMLKWKSLMIFGLPEHYADFISDTISEADFRAKMLIYLIENNLIKIK